MDGEFNENDYIKVDIRMIMMIAAAAAAAAVAVVVVVKILNFREKYKMKAFYKEIMRKASDNRDSLGRNINSACTDEHLPLTFAFTVSNSYSVREGNTIFVRTAPI
jgi:hypothetical protein